ncbi:MAG TPA: pyruvate kinase alpha/beta domain-containing protein, partial [archaeon]|nr:pyruvate kinase alpha/beta domain-containing protein [archaeon]
KTAMTVSRYRFLISILGLSSDYTTLRRLSLIWGINPLKVDYSDDMNVITEMAQKAAVENGFK